MRKKSKAQLYLERVEYIDTVVQNKLIEQRQWHDLALSITANMGGERVQSSGSKSKMADAVDHCVDAEDYILRSVQRLKAEKREIISVIEQVDSPIFYNVLHLRYIQYKSLQEIADKYKRSYDWVKTTHGRAIANVQRILDSKIPYPYMPKVQGYDGTQSLSSMATQAAAIQVSKILEKEGKSELAQAVLDWGGEL